MKNCQHCNCSEENSTLEDVGLIRVKFLKGFLPAKPKLLYCTIGPNKVKGKINLVEYKKAHSILCVDCVMDLMIDSQWETTFNRRLEALKLLEQKCQDNLIKGIREDEINGILFAGYQQIGSLCPECNKYNEMMGEELENDLNEIEHLNDKHSALMDLFPERYREGYYPYLCCKKCTIKFETDLIRSMPVTELTSSYLWGTKEAKELSDSIIANK